MSNDTLMVVIAIGVGILLLVQALVFVGLYLLMRRLVGVIERVAQLQTRAEYVFTNFEPVLKTLQGMMGELRQATTYFSQGVSNLTSITEMAKDEAAEVRHLLGDSTALAAREVERAKAQIARVQNTLTSTTSQFEVMTQLVQNSVLQPAREFSYVMAGVHRAIEYLLSGRRLSVDRAYQDEEMFI